MLHQQNHWSEPVGIGEFRWLVGQSMSEIEGFNKMRPGGAGKLDGDDPSAWYALPPSANLIPLSATQSGG